MTESGAPEPAGAKAVTHERILRAATALFLERGFKDASTREIASRAGVSRAAVFWHFGSKAGLFQEACKELLVPFREAFELTLQHLDPRKRLFEQFAVYARFVESHRPTIEAFVRFSLGSPDLQSSLRRQLLALQGAFEHKLEETLRELLGPREAGPIAAALVALLDGDLLLSLLDPESPARERRRAGVEAIARRLLDSRDVR